MDIEITGPGMVSPVSVRWADIVKSVRPGVGLFDRATQPRGELGPFFELRIFNFIPSDPPTYVGVSHWSYYPRIGLIRTGEAWGPWVKPNASVRSTLDQAIAGATRGDTAGSGHAERMWGFLVLILMLLILGLAVSVVLVARRARQRGIPSVNSGTDDQ